MRPISVICVQIRTLYDLINAVRVRCELSYNQIIYVCSFSVCKSIEYKRRNLDVCLREMLND